MVTRVSYLEAKSSDGTQAGRGTESHDFCH